MRYVIGITGASGSIYAQRIIDVLKSCGHTIELVITNSGKKVFEYETGMSVIELGKKVDAVYDINDVAAKIASGSQRREAMIIVPCSMKTTASIACGISDNLLTRAADVMLKEGRPLVIVPRETPMSAIHLENLLKLSRLGVKIIPAAPGFYARPQTIDDLVDMLVGKILDNLNIEHRLYERWDGSL